MKKHIYLLLILPFFTFNLINAQNNALDFAGDNDYVNIPSFSLNGNTGLTIEAWVYAQSYNVLTIDNYISNIAGHDDASALLRIGDNAPGVLVSDRIPQFVITTTNGNVKCNATTQMSLNTWYHIAGTYDGSNLRIYVNGKLENTVGKTGNISAILTEINLGGSLVDRFLDGYLDEVRIWNDARSQAEIRANMHQELSGNEAGLLAYYNSNATSGTSLADNSTNSYTGTLTNMVGTEWHTSSAFYGPKKCLNFDGGDDNVWISSFTPTLSDAATISFWIKLNGTPDDNARIISNGPDYSTGDEIYLSSGVGSIHTVNFITGDALISTNPLSIGVWTHVAITANGSGSNLYINGVLDDTGGPAAFSYSSFRIGGQYTSGIYECVNGNMDEVRVWNHVRTVSQIKEFMNKSLTGNEIGLVAYYNFDNTSGTVLQDLSPNGNDGGLGGMADNDWIASTAFNTWLNTDDSDWATASNWSNGVPGSTDNIGIYNYTNSPASSADLSINNLYLGTDANFNLTGSLVINGNAFLNSALNITSGKYMTVDGELSIADINKASNLTIASGASLITNGTVSGNTTIEKILSNDSKWHLISIPITGETSFSFLGDYLQYWSEPDGEYLQFGEEELPLEIMKGYSFWGTHADATYSFTGTPITGDQSIGITATGSGDYTGANLLGNPYPSAIDWDLVSGYGAVYYWDGGAYVAYPASTPNPGGGTYGTGSQYIAPMQGFFIVAAEAGTFTLTNAMRTHSGASSFYKSTKNSLSDGILLQASNGSYMDQLLIRLFENTSANFEQEYDAWKFPSNTSGLSQLWSVCTDGKLSIDVRPYQETIQLGFSNNINGNYSIGIKEIADINSAELEDTKLNTFHDLSQGTYQFDWNTTDSEERFILHLKATGTEELVEQEAQVYSHNSQVYIRQTSPMAFQTIQIFDLAGRVIYSGNLNQTELQSINLSHLSGAYLVQLSGEFKNQTNKVIL